MSYHTVKGRIPYAGFQTSYTIVGEGDKTPLLTLHGGPGAGSGYLRSLDPVSESGRKIIYYDQLGCGRSPADSNPSRWTIEFFVEELKTVVRALGLECFHMFGQSWGGFLAINYAAENPAGLKSLILANVPVDWPLWDAEGQRLAAEMPFPYREVLLRAIKNRSEDDPAYPEAWAAFFQKHWVHRPELPPMDNEPPTEPGRVMEGMVAFHTTGTLREADATALLPLIKVPALVISGEYDQCTDRMVEKMMNGLPRAVGPVKLKDSGHISNADDPEGLNRVVRDFLKSVDE